MNNFDYDLLGRLIVVLVLTIISTATFYCLFLSAERILKYILKYIDSKKEPEEKEEPEDVFFFGPVSDWKEWGKK